jgi:hypothetical protein
MLRGLANEESVTTMGSVSGTAQTTRIRCPVATAGIHRIREAADMSRFAVIEMDRQINRASPVDVLLNDFGDDLIFVRQNLPQVMYHHAYEAYKVHKEMRTEFSRHETRGDSEIDNTRTREMFYGMLSIMKLAGRDYKKFYQDYCVAFQSLLKQLATVSISDDLVEEMMYMRFVDIPDPYDSANTKMANVDSILRAGLGKELNQKGVGVYYEEEHKWIVVHWPTLRPTFMKFTEQFKNYTTMHLKNHAQRSKFHVSDEQVVKSKVLESIKEYIGNVGVQAVSVYRVHEYVNTMKASNVPTDVSKPKGHETASVIDMEKYKAGLGKRKFPKPPPPKKKSDSGTSKSSESDDKKTSEGSKKPEFDY